MNVLVTYWSQTGNTRKIAEAIFRSLVCDKTLKPFKEVETLDEFDLIFIGYPIMQFGPPPVARKFITLAEDKNVALFITHATVSNSSDPSQQAMLAKELDKCIAICAHTKLLGMYHCQGELSEKISEELNNSGIPMLMSFAAMRPSTLGHPNPEEIKLAAEFAMKTIENIAPCQGHTP